MSLAQRCKEVRAHFGVSARGMSARLEVSNSLWIQYELGVREPTCTNLLKLQQMGISIDWLLPGSDDMLLEGKKSLNDHYSAQNTGLSEISTLFQSLISGPAGTRLVIWSSVIEKLRHTTSSFTFDQLTGDLTERIPLHQLQLELKAMEKYHILPHSNGQYRKVWLTRTDSSAVTELKRLMIVQRLLNAFLPRLKRDASRGLLTDGTVKVLSGTGHERARELASLIREWRERVSLKETDLEGDSIDFLLGMMTGTKDATDSTQ